MDLQAVMTELAGVVDDIGGINVYPYPADKIVPPAAVFWPEDISYDLTMGRGSDRMTLRLWVAVGRAIDKSAWEKLSAYADGSGDQSIKATLEAGTYSELGSVRVTRCEFGEVTVAANSYLAAMFDLDILGGGR